MIMHVYYTLYIYLIYVQLQGDLMCHEPFLERNVRICVYYTLFSICANSNGIDNYICEMKM